MAYLPPHEMTPWNRRPLAIPPDSRQGWLRLAVWQLWMGAVLCGIIGFGSLLIVTAPNRLITVYVDGNCHAPSPPSPVVRPCEPAESGAVSDVTIRTGGLYAVFSVLAGVLMFVLATWFLWELWSAAAPKPITDDFLKLLHDSFARNWRDPRTWPWSRLAWAYGFTTLGAVATAGAAVLFWSLLEPSVRAKPPVASVGTSQVFRLGE
jgi:hypothetical protein